jgi:hypothetical protein
VKHLVSWAVGGTEEIEADTPEEAKEIMSDQLPRRDCEWTEITIEEPPT